MTILYSLVARGKTVLSEFTFTSGNFPTITRLLLAKIDCGRDGKVSYVYDQYVFHYLVTTGFCTSACATTTKVKRGAFPSRFWKISSRGSSTRMATKDTRPSPSR